MSPKGTLNRQDWLVLGKATLKYFAPLIVIFLVALQNGMPIKDALVVVYGGLLQLAINFFSKLSDGPITTK